MTVSLTAGCRGAETASQGGESVCVVVYTGYEVQRVVAGFGKYSGWMELLSDKFDGSEQSPGSFKYFTSHAFFSEYVFVVEIGKLKGENASEIVLYYNGEYSPYTVNNLPYNAGDTIAFAREGFNIPPLTNSQSHV